MSVELLRKQRAYIKAKLTKFRNFVKRIIDDPESTTREEIEARLQYAENAYARFQLIMQQLVIIVADDEVEQRDLIEETEFEKKYFELKAVLVQHIERPKQRSQNSNNCSGSQNSDSALATVLERQAALIQQLTERAEIGGNEALSQILEHQALMLERLGAQTSTPRELQVKLPIIKLPTFNGKIEDWKRYAETFKALIHDSDLSNIQKYQYLFGSLIGPVSRIIKSIEICEQNYPVAWKLLRKR